MLTLRTLGSLNLRGSDGEEITAILSQPKRCALLVYLAIARPGDFHRRDTLLTLFWPERDDVRARNALSQSLSFLRRHLPDGTILSRGTEEVGVASEAISGDVARFRAALAESRWAEALDLYRGEFLAGFHVGGAIEFEDWLAGEREHLREGAAGAAWSLAREQIGRGALVDAERTAQRAMDLVCTDESPVRGFIEALAKAGDRAAAVNFYERFSARLREKLEIDPSPGIAELAEGIRNGVVGEPPDHAPFPEPPSGTSEFTPVLQLQVEEAVRDPSFGSGRLREKVRRSGVALLVLAGVAVGVVAGAKALVSRTEDLSESRIAVLPLVNQTGDASLEAYGSLAADWIVEAMDEADLGRPVPFPGVVLAKTAGGNLSDSRLSLQGIWRAETGADLAVLGSYYLLADSLFFTLKVVDEEGKALGAVPPVGGAPGDGIEILERLRFAVLMGLEELLAPDRFRLMWPEGDPPRNLDIGRALNQAALVLGTEGPAAAIPLFEEVAKMDTSYLTPLRWMIGPYIALGEYAKADSLCAFLGTRGGSVPTQARFVTQMYCAYLHGDHQQALDRARDLLEFSPAYYNLVGYYALGVNRPREAEECFSQYDPTPTRFAESWADWNYEGWVQALHWLGDHRKELKVAREARKRFPENRLLLQREVVALIALGREDEALEVLEAGLGRISVGASPDSLLDAAAREYDEKGNPGRARELWERLINWHELRSHSENQALEERFFRVDALLNLGRPDQAEAIFSSLDQGELDPVGALGRLGLIMARLGRIPEATRISEQLRSWDDPYDFGENTFWRACIATSLGEKDAAVALLYDALAEGMTFLRLSPRESPFLSSLRGHPGFEDLIRPKG